MLSLCHTHERAILGLGTSLLRLCPTSLRGDGRNDRGWLWRRCGSRSRGPRRSRGPEFDRGFGRQRHAPRRGVRRLCRPRLSGRRRADGSQRVRPVCLGIDLPGRSRLLPVRRSSLRCGVRCAKLRYCMSALGDRPTGRHLRQRRSELRCGFRVRRRIATRQALRSTVSNWQSEDVPGRHDLW